MSSAGWTGVGGVSVGVHAEEAGGAAHQPHDTADQAECPASGGDILTDMGSDLEQKSLMYCMLCLCCKKLCLRTI